MEIIICIFTVVALLGGLGGIFVLLALPLENKSNPHNTIPIKQEPKTKVSLEQFEDFNVTDAHQALEYRRLMHEAKIKRIMDNEDFKTITMGNIIRDIMRSAEAGRLSTTFSASELDSFIPDRGEDCSLWKTAIIRTLREKGFSVKNEYSGKMRVSWTETYPKSTTIINEEITVSKTVSTITTTKMEKKIPSWWREGDSSIAREILEALSKSTKPMTGRELAYMTGQDVSQVLACTWILVREGRVCSTHREVKELGTLSAFFLA